MENPGSRVSKISGTRSSLTDNIPVIFLLKTEADILLGLMAGSDKRNVSITGGVRSRLDMNNLQLFLQTLPVSSQRTPQLHELPEQLQQQQQQQWQEQIQKLVL